MKRDAVRVPHRRVLMLANGSAQQTTGRLINALASGLRRHDHEVDVVLRTFPRGVLPKLLTMLRADLKSVGRVAKADVLVVHTALSLSLIQMVVARLLGRPVISLVWDIYPDSTRSVGNTGSRRLLRLYGLTERIGYALSSRLVLLSDDYRNALPNHRGKIHVLPPWPCDPIGPAVTSTQGDSTVLRIGFAGQVNSIRGLQRGLDQLVGVWKGEGVELHIFSGDRCPDAMKRFVAAHGEVQLVEHGFLSAGTLQDQLRALDAGWVCLDPDYHLPAFPSKTMAYLAAGIPIVYTGPSMPALESWLARNELGLTARCGTVLPADLDSLRKGFGAARSAYLARMEDAWFDLGALL